LGLEAVARPSVARTLIARSIGGDVRRMSNFSLTAVAFFFNRANGAIPLTHLDALWGPGTAEPPEEWSADRSSGGRTLFT
jgi:hypothetical protein